MSTNTRNSALLTLCGIFVFLALWTLLPTAASKKNDLGYYSHCPFAPWSTLILSFLGLVAWSVRSYLMNLDVRRSQRPKQS